VRKVTWILLISLMCVVPACTDDTGTGDTDTPATTDATTPSTTPDADNTARNADNPAADVTNQSETEADIRISAAVRKAVTDDKTLSVNAHNAKITTTNGVVTLRGPVKSEMEKSTIEAKAKAVAGVTRVENLLEVEKNP
jgi:osmotically-inducible protein OsmY